MIQRQRAFASMVSAEIESAYQLHIGWIDLLNAHSAHSPQQSQSRECLPKRCADAVARIS